MDWLSHYANEGCWFLRWIGSFQVAECRWSGHIAEEEVKSVCVHVAIIDPADLLFSLEMSLAIGQQLNNCSKNRGMGCIQALLPQWPLNAILSDSLSNTYSILFTPLSISTATSPVKRKDLREMFVYLSIKIG